MSEQTVNSKSEEKKPDQTAEELRSAKEQIQGLKSQISGMDKALVESRKAIEALKDFNDDMTKQKVEQARSDLLAELKKAKKDGDVDKEVDIQSEISKLDRAVVKEEKKAEATSAASPSPQPDVQLHPDMVAWMKENPWYNDKKNKVNRRKTAVAAEVAAEMREEGNRTMGRAFLDELARRVEAEFAPAGGERDAGNAAGGGAHSGGGSGGGSGGKSWADIPEAHRDIATKQFKDRLVGKGKAYETVADWHKGYAAKYWAQF